tara:strand:+ start:39 stop:338 length:300 start_codon:yes stop_codon:yes gene_type:complete
MKKKWHEDNECYLLFGKEINQIISMLQYLSDRNPDVQDLDKFVEKLKGMRSYDDMLDEMIMRTRVEDLSMKEQTNEGLSLEEILYRMDLRLPGDENGQN